MPPIPEKSKSKRREGYEFTEAKSAQIQSFVYLKPEKRDRGVTFEQEFER